jgi:hypothetical protein
VVTQYQGVTTAKTIESCTDLKKETEGGPISPTTYQNSIGYRDRLLDVTYVCQGKDNGFGTQHIPPPQSLK